MTTHQPIDHSIRISIGHRRIVAAFFNPEDLKAWWGVRCAVVEPRPGGLYLLAWPETQAGSQGPWSGILAGVVREYHPTDGFSLTSTHWLTGTGDSFGPSDLTIRIDGKINQSILTVRQAGFPTDPDGNRLGERASRGWVSCLSSLKNYLDADPPTDPSTPD